MIDRYKLVVNILRLILQTATAGILVLKSRNVHKMSNDAEIGEPEASEISPSQRIAELNDIDNSVSALLSSASKAVAVLADQDSSNNTLESAQEGFRNATSTYFSTLSSIEVRLRRQVYALEEAGLIQPGEDRDARRGRALNEDPSARRAGGGPLDSSWLNARSKDAIGQDMKREILNQTKEFLAQVKDKTTEADSMQVDEPGG